MIKFEECYEKKQRIVEEYEFNTEQFKMGDYIKIITQHDSRLPEEPTFETFCGLVYRVEDGRIIVRDGSNNTYDIRGSSFDPKFRRFITNITLLHRIGDK